MTYLFRSTAVALALCLGTVSCTNGQIDVTKVQDAAKTACGILIAANSVLAIFAADASLTIGAIVSLVCSTFTAQQAAQGKLKTLAPGSVVHVPVIVNGKTIDVVVTTQ